MERTPVTSSRNAKRARLPYHSLAERLEELRREVDREPDATFVGRLYDHLYRTHFDRPSRRDPSNMRTNTILGRVFSWCLQNEVDVATYIAANMTLLKPRLGRHGFQPNMLSGDNAAMRYNGYLSRANKRYRRGTHEVFIGSETWLGRTREQLVMAEEAVADYFVRLNLRGIDVTWDAAVEVCEVTDAWIEFTNHRGAWRTFAQLYDSKRPEQERRLMQLRAAWAVSQGLRTGLPNRIGFTEFSWPAFLDLMRQVLPDPRPMVSVGAVDDLGDAWGNWGAED